MYFVIDCPVAIRSDVVVAAAFALKSQAAKKITGYGGNGDKRIEYGEMASGKRWRNGLETVETAVRVQVRVQGSVAGTGGRGRTWECG